MSRVTESEKGVQGRKLPNRLKTPDFRRKEQGIIHPVLPVSIPPDDGAGKPPPGETGLRFRTIPAE